MIRIENPRKTEARRQWVIDQAAKQAYADLTVEERTKLDHRAAEEGPRDGVDFLRRALDGAVTFGPGVIITDNGEGTL